MNHKKCLLLSFIVVIGHLSGQTVPHGSLTNEAALFEKDPELSLKRMQAKKVPADPELIRKGLTHTDAWIRFLAIHACVSSGDTNLFPLLQIVAVDEDSSVQSELIRVCRSVAKEHPNLKGLMDQVAATATAKRAERRQAEEKVAVEEWKKGQFPNYLFMLARGGYESRWTPLVKEASSHPEPRMRSAVVEMYRISRNPELKPLYRQAFQDPSPHVVQSAIVTAGDTGDVEMAPEVLKHLTPDFPYRQDAIRTAGKLKQTQAAPLIAAFLKDKDPRVVRLAVQALGQLQDGQVKEQILPLLDAPDPEIRMEAIQTLASLKPTAAEKARIAARLKDPDTNVREAALFVINNMEDPSLAKDVVPLLKDKVPSVRGWAGSTLLHLDRKTYQKQVEALLKDPDEKVRQHIEDSL